MAHYRVLMGMYVDTDHGAPVGPDGRKPDRVYKQGDTVETDKDLARFNGNGMTPKFERLDGQIARGRPIVPIDAFDGMTDVELLAHAAEEEVALPPGGDRAAVIAALRAAK